MGNLRDHVIADTDLTISGFYPDFKGNVPVDGVVFCRIFYQELERARQYESFAAILVNFCFHFKSFREPYFQKIDVESYKYEFVAELYKFLSFAFDHIPVYAGKLVDVGACLFVLILAHQTVKDVQGVEQKVRVDLTLELHIAVLCGMGSFSLLLHFASGIEGIVDNVYYAVDGYLSDQGYYEYKEKSLIHSLGEAERETEADDYGFQKGRRCHEKDQEQYLSCPFKRLHPVSGIPDIQDVETYHYYQSDRIGQDVADDVVYAFRIHCDLGKQENDTDSYDENSSGSQQQPLHVWRRQRIFSLRRSSDLEYSGNCNYSPSEDLSRKQG